MVYELLINAIDKPHAGLGDVMHIAPSPHAWGRCEAGNSHWVIVKAELNEDLAFSLLTPERPPDLTKQYQALRHRGLKIDLSVLSGHLDGGVIPLNVIASAIVVKDRLPEKGEIAKPSSIAFSLSCQQM